MKMVKSLLLGSAAGLVAVAGAQAADLPVKAKPVEYVKVCTLYGAGFYYIPGTDTCIKIGGFFRTEWMHNAGGSFSLNTSSFEGRMNREGNPLRNRSRIIVTFDVRSQTEYGTLRGYARAGWQYTSGDFQTGGSQCASLQGNVNNGINPFIPGVIASPSCTYLDRAFIQFAGFTFGKTQSYFDFFSTGAYSMMTNALWVDTAGTGTPVFAYTTQFGNGLSATISAEDYMESRNPVVASGSIASTISLPGGGWNSGFYASRAAGYNVPDIVGNLRVDQAWGSAQVMGALHKVSATYYDGNIGSSAGQQVTNVGNQTAHPDDKWGHAFGGGITLKMPWDPKDTFSGMVTYCKGASRYCSSSGGGVSGNGSMFALHSEGTLALGIVTDAVFDSFAIGSPLELSTLWSAVGAFEHYWTPTLRTSIYGGYLNFKPNSVTMDTVGTGNCASLTRVDGGTGLPPGCYNWSSWQVGSRTIWNPVANLDIGLEVLYTKVNSAAAGSIVTGNTTAGQSPTLIVGDAHIWSGILRLQRNFWP